MPGFAAAKAVVARFMARALPSVNAASRHLLVLVKDLIRDVCIFYLNFSGIDCLCRSPRRPAGGISYRRLLKMRLTGRAPQILRKTVQFLSDQAADCQRVASLFRLFVFSPISCHSTHEPWATCATSP